jgi:hypothetical protein
MFPLAHRAPSNQWLVALFIFATALQGCGGAQQTEQQQTEEFFKSNPKIAASRKEVAKFSGRVTVDGMAPAQGVTLFVVLNDPEHPTPGVKQFAACDAEGNFEFKTYESGDGVAIGKYVVEFVGLKAHKNRGRSRVTPYVAPDALKNLYNDPEKNKDNPAFIIDVKAPGRTDYEFDLKVADKEAVVNPGQFAATKITVM